MSLATTMFSLIMGERKDPKTLNHLVSNLGRCDDTSHHVEMYGVLLNEKEKAQFEKEIKGLVRKQWNSSGTIEESFWLAYAADMLHIKLAAKTREKKLGMFFYNQFQIADWEDVENFISAIRLI